MKRVAKIVRNTRETQIDLRLVLDGTGKARVSTGIPFLNHMLELLAPFAGAQVSVPALYVAGDRDLVVSFKGMDQHIANLAKFVPKLRKTVLDLSLYFWEGSAGIGGLFEHSTDLYERPTIERLAQHLRHLIEAVTADCVTLRPAAAAETLPVSAVAMKWRT